VDLNQLTDTLRHNAVLTVFFNVLMQQLGLPVPAFPTLLVVASLATDGAGLIPLLLVATVASVLADWVWYRAGRLFGYRVLTGLCRLSINPSSCVSQTEARFVRWGLPSLVVAKFLPGFSTVAPPIAGALRMNQIGFLGAAGLGAALWAGVALCLGWFLKDRVQAVMQFLDRDASSALIAVGLALLVWLSWKLWQRRRFKRLSAVPHITPLELLAALEAERPPLVLDLRGPAMVAEKGPIDGARLAQHQHPQDAVGDWPKDQPIVTICACPEDAGAIHAAHLLLEQGYQSVRPLQGGYEAWVAANQRDARPPSA